jgi:hypothetical protein
MCACDAAGSSTSRAWIGLVCLRLLPAAVTGLWLQLQSGHQVGSAQCASHPRQRTTDDSCKWLRLGYKRLTEVIFRHDFRTECSLASIDSRVNDEVTFSKHTAIAEASIPYKLQVSTLL